MLDSPFRARIANYGGCFFHAKLRAPGRQIVLALIIVAGTPIQSFAGNHFQRKDESGTDSAGLGGIDRNRPELAGAGRSWPTPDPVRLL
jgi:hypothetical protein